MDFQGITRKIGLSYPTDNYACNTLAIKSVRKLCVPHVDRCSPRAHQTRPCSIQPLRQPRLQLIQDVMRHRRFQALMAQGALGLAQIPLGELCAHEAAKIVRLDLRQAAHEGILPHRPPG